MPPYPRERLTRETRKQKDQDVIFVNQVPLHPMERLKKITERLTHPTGRMKNKELQIAQSNVSVLMEGKFSFRLKKILSKTMLFDTSKVNEEMIVDRIIENLPSGNSEYYIIHELETNSFSLNCENGK